MKSQASRSPPDYSHETQGGSLSNVPVAMVAFLLGRLLRYTVFKLMLLTMIHRPFSSWLQLALKPYHCHTPFLTHVLLRLCPPLQCSRPGFFPGEMSSSFNTSQALPSPNIPQSLYDCPFLPVMGSHIWHLVLLIIFQILL